MGLKPPLPRGYGHQRMLEVVRQAGAAGINALTASHVLGVSRDRATVLLGQLAKERKITRVWRHGKEMAIWYMPELAPRMAVIDAAPRKRDQPLSRLTLPPDAPAIVPPGVKVTQCPHGVDSRFTFTPPPGWRGQITKDWRERRMREGRAC